MLFCFIFASLKIVLEDLVQNLLFILNYLTFFIVAQYQFKNISNMQRSYYFRETTFESTEMMIQI